MYVLDMFSDDDREFLGQIKNKTIQTEDKEAKAYDLSTLEKKFGTAVAYDAAFLKPAAMTRTDKEGKVHNLIRGKNGTYADKKEKETIEDKFKEILSYIDPDNSEVTATISTDGDTNVLRITHNGKTTEKTTPNLLKAVEYLEDMGLVKNESEVNEALFPGSELGNKLRNADAFMHNTELNKALGVGVGAGLTGSTAGVSLASSGGGIALFAPALGAGLLTGAMAVLGGVITYKTLKWLASKVFGTTEEALAFAKAHLAAAKQGAQQFEWNGKPYQVKVKDQKQIANLEIQINDLSSRVMNEGEFRDFPGSAKVAVPDDVVKGNINSIDNKIAKLKADMAKLIDRAHSGDQSARKQLAQIDAQRKLKEFAPDEGGGDEKQYLLQLADQMANAMYGPNKNAQATKDIKSKIVAAGGDVKISYNNDTTFNVVMYHPTYFKQGHLIKLVGNGDQVDESTKSVHRISLTVTDPNHPMVSKRKETIQKTVKVTSDNRDKAIKSAIAHYRKKGYKVHDHHYIGTGETGVAEGAELKQAKRKYNQAAQDANTDQVGAGKTIDNMKKSLRQKDVDNNKQGVAEGISNRSVISAIVKAITEKRPDLLKYGSDRVSDAINSVAGMVGNNAQGIESGNLNSWINQVERILAQQIDEGKLTANDSPDTWIKRFQSSNHPKLSGKDPETLKKMALAARGRMLNKTPSLPKSKPVNGNYWWQDKNESVEPAKMSIRDYIKEADRLHDLMQHYDKIGDETNYQKAKAAYLELENSARNGMIPEGEEIKSGRPRVRKVSIMRPDGSKGERFEVLNHAGVRVGPLFDDAKWAKEYLQRHYLKLLNLDEEATANPNDTVTMDVPMLIRIMEFSREDAKTDMDLHDVAEKLIDLSSNGNTLTMKDYDQVVPATNEPAAQEQPHEEPQLETKNVVGGRYWDSAEKRWKDQE